MADLRDGEAKILDCPHEFGNFAYVYAGGEWTLFAFIDMPPGGKGGCLTTAMRGVTHCFRCGQDLNDNPPVRNYVLGRNIPLDEHLTKLLEAMEESS